MLEKSIPEIINSEREMIIMMSCLSCMTFDPYSTLEGTIPLESSLYCAGGAELGITVYIKCDLVF